jgi:bifunctional non-homologous end joining protein LigD
MPRARRPVEKARATRTHHPATVARSGRAPARSMTTIRIPRDQNDVALEVDGQTVRLTNLKKLFWPELGITKGDLLQYYANVAPVLLPHVHDRAMVMKRYPNGAAGEFFFMKRAPTPRPSFIETCAIEHASGNVIEFPMIQDLPSLLWVVNLGCIDLNEWYAPCDDVDRPDYLHFDLDPTPGATFAQIREAALLVHAALDELGMPNHAKTTGSRGLHVYVPIVRGPTQDAVWALSKRLSTDIARRHPSLLTAIYAKAHRPEHRVLVDYNQNAWGRTLASVYSVRPKPQAPVSTPVTWQEVERGIEIEDFRIDNVPTRVATLDDLWSPMLPASTPRADLHPFLSPSMKEAHPHPLAELRSERNRVPRDTTQKVSPAARKPKARSTQESERRKSRR